MSRTHTCSQCILSSGPPGFSGDPGRWGPEGPSIDGPPGQPGSVGSQGLKGPNGASIPGPPGQMGPEGNPGFSGATGTRGLLGPSGPTGMTILISVLPTVFPLGSNLHLAVFMMLIHVTVAIVCMLVCTFCDTVVRSHHCNLSLQPSRLFCV